MIVTVGTIEGVGFLDFGGGGMEFLETFAEVVEGFS